MLFLVYNFNDIQNLMSFNKEKQRHLSDQAPYVI